MAPAVIADPPPVTVPNPVTLILPPVQIRHVLDESLMVVLTSVAALHVRSYLFAFELAKCGLHII